MGDAVVASDAGDASPLAESEPDRHLRADARRNRTAILEAAEALVRDRGLDVPMDDIAERAGVGVGTLYRNFPTKDALIRAVLATRMAPLLDRAREGLRAEDPAAAFFTFLQQMASHFAGFKALADALIEGGFDLESAKRDLTREPIAAATELLARAQRAGAVRPDISIADVTMLMSGLGHPECPFDDAISRTRYVDLVCDALGPGVRVQARGPEPAA